MALCQHYFKELNYDQIHILFSLNGDSLIFFIYINIQSRTPFILIVESVQADEMAKKAAVDKHGVQAVLLHDILKTIQGDEIN